MEKKILIIGDSCVDAFQYGICERLSPEAPVPIFKPTRCIENGGMSRNVYTNIKHLGVDCDVLSNFTRPRKTRLVDEVSNQILVRVDENDKIDPVETKYLNTYDYSKYDALIISDYNKGFLSKNHIRIISNQHPMVFMDTKKELGSWALNVGFIKINNIEYKKNENWLKNKYKGNLIVTKGSEGAELITNTLNLNEKKEFKIENEHPVRDLTGAGDTFLAALVVEYLKNNDINEAIKFANKCASWVVTQKGVVPVDSQKIS